MISSEFGGSRSVNFWSRDERHPPRARIYTVNSDIILQDLLRNIIVQQPAGHHRPLLRAVVVAFVRLGVRVVIEQGRLRFVVVGLLRRGGRLGFSS